MSKSTMPTTVLPSNSRFHGARSWWPMQSMTAGTASSLRCQPSGRGATNPCPASCSARIAVATLISVSSLRNVADRGG
ncbi:hypothetical protein J3R03_008293 [Actinoplanes couchii]|nr:hypothetical protein [Actinoplanes couchii]